MTERYFASCPRGLEPALASELTQIGATDVAATDGGVAFAGDLVLAQKANLESRIASRILWRVGGAPYRNEKDVYALVHAIDLARPLMMGRIPDGIALHIAVLALYAAIAYYVALVLTRRRLLK